MQENPRNHEKKLEGHADGVYSILTARRRWRIFVVIVLISALLSAVGLSYAKVDRQSNLRLIRKLHEYQEISAMLSLSMAGTTIAIGALPGDIGASIADEMMDLTSYVFLGTGALLALKYLVVLMKVFGMGLMMPLGLLLLSWGGLISRRRMLLEIGLKLLAVGLISFCIVNVSVFFSDYVYQVNKAAIEETANVSNEVAEAISSAAEEAGEEKGWFDAVVSSVTGVITGAGKSIGGAFSSGVDWAKATLNSFVEKVLILVLVTTVIPIVTVVLYIVSLRWVLRNGATRLIDAISLLPKGRENALQKALTGRSQQ